MKNFIKLIKQVHEERYLKIVKKITDNSTPVAFLSLEPIEKAVNIVNDFRTQKFNINKLVVMDETPPPEKLGFNVIHLSKAAQIYPQPEYVFAYDAFTAAVALKNFPASKILRFKMRNTNNIYETFMTHLPELQEVYESLIDEESKKTFCGYWLGNISNQIGKIVFADTPHYICAGFIPERGAVVIDGGLCDGGTSVRFSRMGYNVYGFEMDKINYEKAAKAATENHFVAENLGLGAFNHEAAYTHMKNPGASKLDPKGTDTAQIITLDSYVLEKDLPRVDFLKLDVEGAELDVLKGAAITIARYKPILALSAYHKWDDFWTLMNFVKSIRPDYEFAMRQFVISKEDGGHLFEEDTESRLNSFGLRTGLKTFGECVLFAR